MKKSEEMRLKSRINESPLSTADAVPLPRVGKVASGASRIGFQRYEKSEGCLLSGEKMLQFLRQPKIFRGG